MRDLYGWSGLRYQTRLWAGMAGAFALSAAATGIAMATRSFPLDAAGGAAWLAASMGQALWLAAVGGFMEAQTGTMFRLGLGHTLPRFRRYMYSALAALAVASTVPLVAFRVEAYTLAPMLLAQLALVVLCADTAYMHRRHLRHSLMRASGADRRLESIGKRHGQGETTRLRHSIALIGGEAPYANPTNMQRQHVILGLSARPWMERADFPWSASLENDWERVRDEFRAWTAENRELRDYDYPGSVSGKWSTIMLVTGSIPTPESTSFPETMKLLRNVPRFPRFREAQLSVLGPGSRIKPHRDAGNEWITCQLALIIPDPERCGIRVGGIARGWTEGECIFFNTSYEHEAWNDTDKPRVVLIVDFLHPELSDAETEFWAASEDPVAQ